MGNAGNDWVMPRTAAITPVRTKWAGPREWKIDLPASLSPTGKRQRFFFETKQDALNFSDEQRTRLGNFGTQGITGLSPSQLEQAAKAFDAIQPFNASLNEVVMDWVSRRKARDTTVTFAAGYAQYLDHLNVKRVKGRPVSLDYRRQINQCFKRFPSLHKMPLTEIESRTVAAGTTSMTPAMKNAFLRVLGAFFSWCTETPREWIKINPAAKVPRESLGKNEVRIYQPDEVKRLLAASPDDLLPFFLFGFFAGIRPQELKRMDWSHLNLKEKAIVLPATITKTATRRVITVDPALSAWLNWYVSKHGIRQGLVTPSTNLRKRLDAIREAAKVENIQDGARHSYASYWLAVNKDEHRLRENLGHRSSDELWDHYHRACTEKEAKQFWAIRPKGKKQGKIVAFQQEAA
jgi:integrase